MACFVFLIIVVLVGAIWFKHQEATAKEAELQKAKILTESQTANEQNLKNTLQNVLEMNRQNSELTAKAIQAAQSGQVQPVTNFTVQAPTVQAAAQDVAKRIDAKDSTLPPAAIAQTDRTVIAQNTNKTEQANYDVGVFKINNYRNWEWSIGYGQHGGDRYIPIELQRNFSKDAALSYERHFGGKMGYEVKYTKKTDKLFFLF